jgi:hypothetical protein
VAKDQRTYRLVGRVQVRPRRTVRSVDLEHRHAAEGTQVEAATAAHRLGRNAMMLSAALLADRVLRSECGTADGPSGRAGRPSTVPDHVHQLLASDATLDKLGARHISSGEAEQLLSNRHVIVRNPRSPAEPGKRRLLIGRTDGGRALTMVIERTADPTSWLIVTGWSSTAAERTILET